MIGEVCAINEKGFSVRPADRDGVIDVERETWQNCKYRINAETNEIEEKVEGTFSQFPVKAAWAITIHKSQGLTFSHAIIDAHASFTHGQTYVALSRCKTLQGMVLAAPITRSSLISDSTVDAYTREIRNGIPTESDVERMRRAYTRASSHGYSTSSHLGWRWQTSPGSSTNIYTRRIPTFCSKTR